MASKSNISDEFVSEVRLVNLAVDALINQLGYPKGMEVQLVQMAAGVVAVVSPTIKRESQQALLDRLTGVANRHDLMVDESYQDESGKSHDSMWLARWLESNAGILGTGEST